MVAGAARTTDFLVEQSQVDVKVWVERVRSQRVTVVFERLSIVANFFEYVGQVEIRLDVIRFEREASFEGSPGSRALTLVVADGTEVAVGVGVVLFEFERLLVRLDGLCPIFGIDVEFTAPFEPRDRFVLRRRGMQSRAGLELRQGGDTFIAQGTVLLEFEQQLPPRLFKPTIMAQNQAIGFLAQKSQCGGWIIEIGQPISHGFEVAANALERNTLVEQR